MLGSKISGICINAHVEPPLQFRSFDQTDNMANTALAINREQDVHVCTCACTCMVNSTMVWMSKVYVHAGHWEVKI